MITFLTVLKSNKTNEFGKFGHSTYLPEHVYSLQSQIKKRYPKPHNFYCLTDYPDLECETTPLILDLPGWWSKMELFRQTGNIIYFDLDTVILDDITELVEYPHEFSALADIHHNSILPGRLWSGIMAWSGDHTDIYNKFVENIEFNMSRSQQGGDQHFIGDFRPNFTPVQKITSGIVCYKLELKNNESPPPETKIIYFMGNPKPWQLDHKWTTGLYQR